MNPIEKLNNSGYASDSLVLLRGWGNPKPVLVAERYLDLGFPVVLTGPPCDTIAAALGDHPKVRDSKHFAYDPIPDYAKTADRPFPRWSAGLNLGLRHAVERGARYFLPVSNEADPTEEQLLQMFSMLEVNDTLGAVGTTFRGMDKEGSEVGLGRSYYKLRNTLALWCMAVFTEDATFHRFQSDPSLAGFDEMCDSFGGMEDYHRVLTMIQAGRFGSAVLPLNVSLTVGTNYNQADKERTECAAMDKINAYLDLHRTGSPHARSYALRQAA